MAFELIVVGTSLGGLSALKVLLSGIPSNFSVPMAIVQHRHKDSDQLMGVFLHDFVSLPIKEVEDKDEIKPGHIYIAPADYHLLVEWEHFSLSTDAPVSYARPSIDVLFESAADVYKNRVIGVILTGANQDGARGLMQIKQRGGSVIIQDPSTAESAVMPTAALRSLQEKETSHIPEIARSSRKRVLSKPEQALESSVPLVLPLTEIAPQLVYLCHPLRS